MRYTFSDSKVLLNIDRYLSITTKSWRTVHFKPVRAAIYCIAIGVIMALINIYIAIVNGYESQVVTYTNVTDPLTNAVVTVNTTTIKVNCYVSLQYMVYPFWKIVSKQHRHTQGLDHVWILIFASESRLPPSSIL